MFYAIVLKMFPNNCCNFSAVTWNIR